MHFCRALAILLAVGFCTIASAQQKWATYVNERFGAAADYPSDLFSQTDPPPDNGDGQTFRTTDGEAELSIYGSNNIDNDTPESYLTKYANREDVDFKRVTARFYAISGRRGDKIFYERCNFPPRAGSLGCFHIEYPAAQKAVWDKVIARISHSLRAGSE